MAKTKEELNELKNEFEALKTELKELSEEELRCVIGGANVQNENGTVTLYKGQCYYDSYSPFYNTYKVLEDYIGVSKETPISCLKQWKDTANGIHYENCTKKAKDFMLSTFLYAGKDSF